MQQTIFIVYSFLLDSIQILGMFKDLSTAQQYQKNFQKDKKITQSAICECTTDLFLKDNPRIEIEIEEMKWTEAI